MTDFKTRGYAIATTLKYCREGMDIQRRQKVLANIPPELVRQVEAFKATEWYPATTMNQLFASIVASSEGDAATAEQDLVACGKFAGGEATNTFLRLIMKVLTPALFAKKLPSLYARDNSKGVVNIEITDDRVFGTFTDTKGFDHLAPMSAGWIIFALEAMGKKVAQDVRFTGWSMDTPDVERFTIELDWKT